MMFLTCAQGTWSAILTQQARVVCNTPSKSVFLTHRPENLSYTYRDFVLCSFQQLVLSCENLGLRARASQRPTFTVAPSDALPERVEELLSLVIKKELALAGQIEMLKQDLASAPDYNLEFCYK